MIRAPQTPPCRSNLLSIKDSRRTRQSTGHHHSPIIHIDYHSAPRELVNNNPPLEIIYEELAPPDIIEIYHKEVKIAAVSQSNENSRDSEASLSFELVKELETRASPILTKINEHKTTQQSSIEYSPSYSPCPSSEFKEEVDDSAGDIIPGLLDLIPDRQLLNLLKDIDWTFPDDL